MNNKEIFKKRVYKELDRINKLYISLNGKDSILPVLFFNKNVTMGASSRSIKEKIGLNFNDLKETRGLPIQRKGRQKGVSVVNINSRRGIAKINLPVKTAHRICNMCEKPFKAKEDMRSCPACDNLKNSSSGYSSGFDEMGMGFL